VSPRPVRSDPGAHADSELCMLPAQASDRGVSQICAGRMAAASQTALAAPSRRTMVMAMLLIVSVAASATLCTILFPSDYYEVSRPPSHPFLTSLTI